MVSADGQKSNGHAKVEELDRVTIRFAGDSGDGMQLAGLQFTNTSAVFGNDVSTIPDFPAEIRAPAGSIPGVSAFQVSFSSYDIHTPGDEPDVLVAMNPAALKAHLADLPKGGTLIVNQDEFTEVEPQEGELRRESAGRRQPGRLARDQGADHQHEHARPGRQRPQHQADRSLEELLRAGPDVLALRPAAGLDDPLVRGQVREEPAGRATPTSPR